ncbi:hypothetical protein Godav_022297 [Gossypium davidsonii]|uniref:Uncharacterized protein n=1 Tax=Gossypium davidsonii TaxID=34287 RepID=A0A7J8TBK9_GOSDV|nr:hypothetical protein [Gossypium davidsonii]
MEKDYIKLFEGDVITSMENGIPLIKFSEMVYKLVGESMSKFIIIKLIGRQIGFGALHSKTIALESLSTFSVMDLDNNYYMARFRPTDYYTKVANLEESIGDVRETLEGVEGRITELNLMKKQLSKFMLESFGSNLERIRDKKGGTKILLTIQLAKDIHYGENIELVDQSAKETLLEILEVRQTDIKSVELSVGIPPMRKVGYVSDFGEKL